MQYGASAPTRNGPGGRFAPSAEKQLSRACPYCHGTALIVHPDGFRGVCAKCDAWSTNDLPPDVGPALPQEPAPPDKGGQGDRRPVAPRGISR